MSLAAFRLSLVLSGALLTGCAGGLQHLVEQDLKASDGLSCPAYLTWEREPVQQVVLWMHGTGLGSVAFVHPTVEDLVESSPVAYMTLDKPGVRAPFGDPAAVTRDDAPFKRHTQGHLLECARQALTLTNERFGPSVQVHLRGHSEGALIALYLYDELLQEQPERAHQVRSLILSGLPLEPFGAILERQLNGFPEPGRSELRAAIASCNWPVMRDHFGVSCDYLRDAEARPSGFAMFQRLAEHSATLPIHIFQGNSDFHTPAAEARKLMRWNSEVGRLNMSFHFYEGTHSGSPQAASEMQDLFRKLIQPAR